MWLCVAADNVIRSCCLSYVVVVVAVAADDDSVIWSCDFVLLLLIM